MEIKFDEKGLVAVITQDAVTGEVLMQAYMNKEAYDITLETGYMTYYSRSRKCLWKKGETSGHVQQVVAGYIDCDGDALLFKVYQTGAACHTGNRTCFFTETVNLGGADFNIINEDFAVVADRYVSPVKDSYTNYLFQRGTDKICKKIAEESGEVIIAAKNKDKEELTGELCDLLFHAQVLMQNEGITREDVIKECMRRKGKPTEEKYKNKNA